jgi:hypothetical protein
MVTTIPAVTAGYPEDNTHTNVVEIQSPGASLRISAKIFDSCSTFCASDSIDLSLQLLIHRVIA